MQMTVIRPEKEQGLAAPVEVLGGNKNREVGKWGLGGEEGQLRIIFRIFIPPEVRVGYKYNIVWLVPSKLLASRQPRRCPANSWWPRKWPGRVLPFLLGSRSPTDSNPAQLLFVRSASSKRAYLLSDSDRSPDQEASFPAFGA